MALSTEEKMLIEQRISNDAKSPVIAYVLWAFTGYLGGHRFYLGRTGTALAQLILFILGWFTLVFVIGFFMIGAVAIWALVDAFLIPGMLDEDKTAMRQKLAAEA
tara:strand:+ start:716 stop:1030 length:315 start_codon:yes stop_codon:yes gene_type:complete